MSEIEQLIGRQINSLSVKIDQIQLRNGIDAGIVPLPGDKDLSRLRAAAKNQSSTDLIREIEQVLTNRDRREVEEFRRQVDVLTEIKKTLESQHLNIKADFQDIKQRDEQSSKANIVLTLTSSGISLVLGWALSLVGSPATVMHLLLR